MAQHNEAVIHDWSIKLMSRAFRDLATSFAAVDAGLADRAIHAIETTIAAELEAFCKKPPEGVRIDVTAIGRVITPLRTMTQDARRQIKGVTKPSH